MEIILWVILVLVLVLPLMLAAGRFFLIRSRGISVVLRSMPSPENRHWRYSVMMFTPDNALIYKVRSLSPVPDIIINRSRYQIIKRRDLTDVERFFLDTHLHVIHMSGKDRRERVREYEFAVDSGMDTAFVSWLESAPSTRRDNAGLTCK